MKPRAYRLAGASRLRRIRSSTAYAIVTVGVALALLPAAFERAEHSAVVAGSGVEHRLYDYRTASNVQTDIPCGGSSPAHVVYDEITLLETVSAQPFTTAVSLDGLLLWRQEGDVSVRVASGRNVVARILQRLTASGVWTFTANVRGRPAQTCTVTKGG